MDIKIFPGKLSGTVRAIPSKSQAHRLLILAAFADGPTQLLMDQTSRDIEATADCLRALGAQILRTAAGYSVEPIHTLPASAELFCAESGSTLRFLLPVVGALGVNAIFRLEGRLPSRPLSPLWEEMERMGCSLSRPEPASIFCSGKLRPGKYRIPGNISSQYITGLMLALSLMEEDASLEILGPVESEPYVHMTQGAMELFGSKRHSPGCIRVEGDWSNGAFFLAARSLGQEVSVVGLDSGSLQGDRLAETWLSGLKDCCTIPAENIPDLVPILSIAAAVQRGALFTGIRRLRTKESDRVASILSMIRSLGGKAEASEDTLRIWGTGLTGGTVDSCNDHRIAMSAAIAATMCTDPVIITGAQCVQKSYPAFWEDYSRLGGHYEQYLR